VLAAMAAALIWSGALASATLEKLTLDQMIEQSTEIVRAKFMSATAEQRGAVVYTRNRVQVLERWKGSAAAQVDILIPGGRLGNIKQTYAGAPSLQPGVEYVLFLWTGKSGMTQIIGLSQGALDLKPGSKGEPVVARAATKETMLDAKGSAVQDQPLLMTLAALDERIRTVLGAARQ
jgi:hypothetical protein